MFAWRDLLRSIILTGFSILTNAFTLFATTEKPMRIEVVLDPAKVPPPALVNRVAPAPAAKTAAMEGVQRYVHIYSCLWHGSRKYPLFL